MSRFPKVPVVDAEDAQELGSLYSEIVDNGFGATEPINWFTAQSCRPDILEATWALAKGVLIEGELPGTLKQMTAMAISLQNECRYCAVTHTGALEAMGVPDQVIVSCASDPDMADVPEPHRSAVRFALKAARAPNSVTDQDLERLTAVGLSRGEILEVAMMAAFTNFINTWADVSGIPVDGESE